MNKLEVGMYVRYTRGSINGYVPHRIGKILERLNDSQFIKLDTNCTILENDIIGEPSFNPIDLIEVGDFIDYLYPTGLGILRFKRVEVTEGLLNILQNGENNHEYEIEAVVTKEQFESMEYGLGDD